MAASPLRTWIRRIWIGGGLLFTGWLAWNLQAAGVPASDFVSDPSIEVVVEDDRLLFLPRQDAGV